MKRKTKLIILVSIILIIFSTSVYGESSFSLLDSTITVGSNEEPGNYVFSLQLLLLLTILTLAPSILIMMTGFTRMLIVLAFIRNALGLQQTPPNQVIIGIALFLTFFIMAPIASEINTEAVQPYINSEISQDVAIERAMTPIRNFMFKQTRDKDLGLFLNMKGIDSVSNLDEIPTHVLIPAFIISELKTAFQIGFIIFIPFLVIDMVVASTLMAMGMMMLPPVIISLPFKLLLFVLVDGWNLIAKSLVLGFN
ncbi:MAG: flagellar type III secretion system pore protein FliP [Tissierellia bacterium]|nr:flagellar type III secretion system pore protein FliP [Tissierellia bacterium]